MHILDFSYAFLHAYITYFSSYNFRVPFKFHGYATELNTFLYKEIYNLPICFVLQSVFIKNNIILGISRL